MLAWRELIFSQYSCEEGEERNVTQSMDRLSDELIT